MKIISLSVTFLFFLISGKTFAQTNYEKYKSTANKHFSQGEYKEALDNYEIGYSNPNHIDNYGTFYAAMSACQVKDTTKALYYLSLSSQVGYDYSNFDHFINHPLNSCLKSTKEWEKYAEQFKRGSDSIKVERDKLERQLAETINLRVNKTLLSDTNYWNSLPLKLSAKELIKKIKNFNDFPQTKDANFWTNYTLRINDTLNIPYLVHIPKDYNSSEIYPLYVYLHGGVINRLQFGDPVFTIRGAEAKLMTNPKLEDGIVLFPLGKRNFGWLHQQSAFEAIIKQIAEVKSLYNIDDNKVYIGGHSNGGSGAFWFANKMPTPFASFFAFNFLPLIYSSNTSHENLKFPPPFYSINGLKDGVFSYEETNKIYEFSRNAGAVWFQSYLNDGHSLPFNGNDSVLVIFDWIKKQTRNPFSNQLYWETDNVRNGRKYWVEIVQLDTNQTRADWHTERIPELIEDSKFKKFPLNKNKAGAVQVSIFKKNSIFIESSRVKRIRIYFSEDMFDLRKNIKLYNNGKVIFNSRIKPNSKIIASEFLKSYDRKFIVSNILEIDLE